MQKTRLTLALVALAAGSVVSTSALAWHHHHRHGARVVLGFNFGYPAYYPHYYPAYYPPAYYPPVVVQQAPTTYVERAEPAPSAPAASNYWHYCQDSRAYYPYVKECPGGWQRVSPTPQ
jgi:hypothetical protein